MLNSLHGKTFSSYSAKRFPASALSNNNQQSPSTCISLIPVSYFVLWFPLISAGIPRPNRLPCASAVPYACCWSGAVAAASVVHVVSFSHPEWRSGWGIVQTVRGSIIMYVWNTARIRRIMLAMNQRNFVVLDAVSLPILFWSLAHLHLEYGYAVWHTSFKGDKQMVVVVVVAFSLLARIWGKCLTIHSLPALFSSFFF